MSNIKQLKKHIINHSKSVVDKYMIEKLQHHYDSTVGLWCTDKPELIPDKIKHNFFQLEKVDK